MFCREYTLAKVRESYGFNNLLGYPKEERFGGRPTKRVSPLYDTLVKRGAEMGFHSGRTRFLPESRVLRLFFRLMTELMLKICFGLASCLKLFLFVPCRLCNFVPGSHHTFCAKLHLPPCAAGWEQPHWFCLPGDAPGYHPSFHRTNWHQPVMREVGAVMTRVGVADLTPFAKLEVTGPDAVAFMDRICANNVPKVNLRSQRCRNLRCLRKGKRKYQDGTSQKCCIAGGTEWMLANPHLSH